MPLSVKNGMGAWVSDFQKSDAPQFKGKSEKERREMAIAAYMSAKNDSKDEGFVSAAQRKAVWANKADGGKGHPDNKKESAEAPFQPDAKKQPAKNSDGSIQSPMSRVKALAKKARDANKSEGYSPDTDPDYQKNKMISKTDKNKLGKLADMMAKERKPQKEASYGTQAQRLMSPLQKARQDKEKLDREKQLKNTRVKEEVELEEASLRKSIAQVASKYKQGSPIDFMHKGKRLSGKVLSTSKDSVRVASGKGDMDVHIKNTIESVEQIDELTAEEKRLINMMYDKKGNLTDMGKKVMDHGKTNSKLTPKNRDADNARRKEYNAYQKSKRNEEAALEDYNWKVSHAGQDVHVKAPHAGAAVKKAQKGFGNKDLTKAKISNLGKVGTPAVRNEAGYKVPRNYAQMISKKKNKVKLGGFGPDAPKSNMGNSGARAALRTVQPKNEETVSEAKSPAVQAYLKKRADEKV